MFILTGVSYYPCFVKRGSTVIRIEMLLELQTQLPQMAEKYSMEDLEMLNIPLLNRDFCVHFFVPYIQCRRDTFYLPWYCREEMDAWNHCQLEDHYDRVRQKRRLDKMKRKAVKEANSLPKE